MSCFVLFKRTPSVRYFENMVPCQAVMYVTYSKARKINDLRNKWATMKLTIS